eukprot:scaffold32704_cov67-Skeletonema_dohrnii-CCMP3373.AAC.1
MKNGGETEGGDNGIEEGGMCWDVTKYLPSADLEFRFSSRVATPGLVRPAARRTQDTDTTTRHHKPQVAQPATK